jgi:solute carrier family 25 (adenine nucleotide translocator) protein 4/5/6/31
MTKSQNVSFIESFTISGIAAIISKTIAGPVERLKLILQNQGELIKSGRLQTSYKGIIDCTLTIYKKRRTFLLLEGKLY